MAPKISRSLPYKLITIFLTQIILAVCIFVAVGHGSWNSQTWTMANGRSMSWDVTLHHIASKVDCTGKVEFYHTCLTTFKRTAGSVSAVRDMICGLDHSYINAPDQYHQAIRRLASSCDGMRKLDSTSLAVFIMLLISGCLILASFLSLLKWCYSSFSMRKKVWYHVGIFTLVLEIIITFASLMIYALGLGGLGPIFSYTEPPLIWAQAGGSRGWGYWMIVVTLILHSILFYFWWAWIPRGLKLEGADDYSFRVDDVESAAAKRQKNAKKVKKAQHAAEEQPLIHQQVVSPRAPEPPTQDSGKKVFWAFMPEVLQPAFGGDDQYLMQQQRLEEQQQVFYAAPHQSQQAVLAAPTYSGDFQSQQQVVQYVSQPLFQGQPQQSSQIVAQPMLSTSAAYQQQQPAMMIPEQMQQQQQPVMQQQQQPVMQQQQQPVMQQQQQPVMQQQQQPVMQQQQQPVMQQQHYV